MQKVVLFYATLLVALAAVDCARARQPTEEPSEVTLSNKEFGRLNIFEDRELSVADAAFEREKYAAARTAYAEFLKKHPKSPVAAYVLLRQGRCAELEGKQAEAITSYVGITKKFPKLTKYAVPALLHAADCHLAEGERDQAVEMWSRIADNAEYRKSPRAAEAIDRLLDTASKSGNPEDVLKLYDRLKLDWRNSNEEAVKKAVAAVVRQHVRITPDQAKLVAFYKQITKDAGEQSEKSLPYWIWVSRAVTEHGQFSYSEDADRKKYYNHWIGVFKDKFPKSDDIRLALIQFEYGAARDRAKLSKQLDELFAKNKKSDWRRTLKWVRVYKGNWTKIREYTAKVTYENAGIEGVIALVEMLVENKETYLATSTFKKVLENVPFDKLSNEQIMQLLATATGSLKDSSISGSLVEKLHFDKMTEDEKLKLAREFLETDGAIARKIYAQLKDQGTAQTELFEHFTESGQKDLAIAVAGELAEIEQYAKTFSLKHARLLKAAGRYTEAATAYQKCGDEPEHLWQIVECYVAMKDTDNAVQQLRAIAAAHKAHGSKATYRIAMLYHEAEAEKEHLAALREVVKKYPGSAEAEKAEGELGEKGVAPSLPEPLLDL